MPVDETNATDPKAEIKAMTGVTDALAGLDSAATARVLQWAAARFGLNIAQQRSGSASPRGTGASDKSGEERTFATFADLFGAAQPATDADRALVAGYWTQFVESEEDFASQTLNSMLKNLGHGVSNITKALETLKAQSPALVMQVRKSGTSQQARKKYKLTAAGKRAVELLIGQN